MAALEEIDHGLFDEVIWPVLYRRSVCVCLLFLHVMRDDDASCDHPTHPLGNGVTVGLT